MIAILHFSSLFPESFIHWFVVTQMWKWGFLLLVSNVSYEKKRKKKKKISCIAPYSSVIDNWFHNLVARRRCSWLFSIFGMETRSSVACCNAVVNHMLKTLLTTCSGFQLIQPKLFITNSINISKQINSNTRKLTTVLNKLLEIIVTLLVIDAIALVPTVSQAPC